MLAGIIIVALASMVSVVAIVAIIFGHGFRGRANIDGVSIETEPRPRRGKPEVP